MRRADEIAGKLITSESPTQSRSSEGASKVTAADAQWRPSDQGERDLLDNFWANMAALYPVLWARRYGEVPMGAYAATWLTILRQMPARQIKLGLRWCLESSAEYPPRPGRFREIVRENDRPEHRPLPRSRRLERQATDPEEAKARVNRLREVINGGE